jgi:hypothetical protein
MAYASMRYTKKERGPPLLGKIEEALFVSIPYYFVANVLALFNF